MGEHTDRQTMSSTTQPSPAEQRAVAFLRRLGGVTTRLALLGLVGGALAWEALRRALAREEDVTLVLVVTAILVLAPPVILGLFVFALRALRSLPQRIREAPGTVRERATEIRRRAGEVGSGRPGLVGGIRSLVRLWSAVSSSREVVDGLAPAALLLNPWMLGAAAVAAGAAVIEVILGVVALILLAIGAVI